MDEFSRPCFRRNSVILIRSRRRQLDDVQLITEAATSVSGVLIMVVRTEVPNGSGLL